MKLPFAQLFTLKKQIGSALTGYTLLLGLWFGPGLLPTNAASPGTVAGWGNNDYAQLNAPVSLNKIIAISAGFAHAAALKSDGTVAAWGYNVDGETTGTSKTVSPFTATANPVTLNGVTLTGVIAVAAGQAHTVALKSDGTVVVWGGNTYGQTTVPVGLSGVTAIAAGGDNSVFGHTVVLKSDGTVVAWGDNSFGQVTGTPTLVNHSVATANPVALSGLVVTGIVAISAGRSHTVALRSDGTVIAWGNNASGQTTVPSGLSGVTAIAAGGEHSVALKSDGTVVAWGDNQAGQTTTPPGLNGVASIAAGFFHTVALRKNGTVVSWGANTYGQTTVPPGLGGVVSIAAGSGDYTLALIGPIITTQPLGQYFALNDGVSLSVSATGVGLTYQWQFNGTDIAGATSPVLNITNLTAADAGAYHVVVSSTAGGITSVRRSTFDHPVTIGFCGVERLRMSG